MTAAGEAKMTRAEYVLLPERNVIQNLLGGELRVKPAPTPKHPDLLARLDEEVGLFARDRLATPQLTGLELSAAELIRER